MLKVPGLSLPYSQKRTYTVLPGVRPLAVIMGMAPLALASSSQVTRVNGPLHAGAV